MARPARRRGPRPVRILQYLLLILVLVISAGPLVWVLINAIRPDSEIAAYPPTLFPQQLTGDHFVSLFTLYGFGTYVINSLVISTVATLGALVFGTLAAYAMARFDYRLVRVLGELSLVAYLIPPILVLVPVTQILFGSGPATTGWRWPCSTPRRCCRSRCGSSGPTSPASRWTSRRPP